VTTFALIHGAWGTGWHWAGLPGALRALGHDAVAPDLPADPAATFDDYADVVVDALRDAGDDVTVVGYSLGGNTAPLVAARRPVRELIYLAAFIPEPGVSFNAMFARGDRMLLPEYLAGLESRDGYSRWVDFDVYRATGSHDCDEDVVRERFARSRRQYTTPYDRPCSLTAPPDVPTRYVLCSEDRLMNNAFWRPAVRERLGGDPVEIASSHSPMVSRPEELAGVLTGR
jgi:pimeloyl-ACP methyl ester carboxylesterase